MYKNEANQKVLTKMKNCIYHYVITCQSEANSTPIRNIFILSLEFGSYLDLFSVYVAIKTLPFLRDVKNAFSSK